MSTKKYKTRKSPPYSAAACPRQTLFGNDGRKYISDRRGNSKSYRWYPVKQLKKRNVKLQDAKMYHTNDRGQPVGLFDVRGTLGHGFTPSDDVLNTCIDYAGYITGDALIIGRDIDSDIATNAVVVNLDSDNGNKFNKTVSIHYNL